MGKFQILAKWTHRVCVITMAKNKSIKYKIPGEMRERLQNFHFILLYFQLQNVIGLGEKVGNSINKCLEQMLIKHFSLKNISVKNFNVKNAVPKN